MVPRKLSVAIARYPYGGTGGTNVEVPDIGDWLVKAVLWLKSDERVGEIFHERFSDTPITMTRNRSVVWARQCKADVLLMLDSDMYPDLALGQDRSAKPFLESSFDFIYRNYDKGPHVVAAPYCGPPPFENSYIFVWRNFESNEPGECSLKLDQYKREESAIRSGIEECAALPTGCIMWDMRAFDLIDPIERGWFYYEWDGPYAAAKASTEDVTATRDISLAGYRQLGYNPIHVNWDAWAGHWKPKCVGKPALLTVDILSENVRKALDRGMMPGEKLVTVKRQEFPKQTPIIDPTMPQWCCGA